MSLKLFRSTGYASILDAGEVTVATHPFWAWLGASLWLGFACNVALWRAIGSPATGPSLAFAIGLGIAVAAAAGLVLSLLGSRKTFKPAAILLLLAGSLIAYAIWDRGWMLDANAIARGLPSGPGTFPNIMRWQFAALVAVLGILPAVWLRGTTLRRLDKPQQFQLRLACFIASAIVLAACLPFVFHGVLGARAHA
ncbi:MAG: phosphoethanolamine transferase domain-containing protein [Burkholderiaceae bacterium]